MLKTLRQPKWMLATVVVIALAVVFIRLGIWQLDRLEQRKELNSRGEERISAQAVDIRDLLDAFADDLASIEYRRVLLSGRYDTSEEVLVRSQVALGQAGFHVITPLVLEDGSAVLINRGWVPLDMDSVPVEASPPGGLATVEGWVHLSETRPSFGPEDPAGDLEVFNRVDLARIGDQIDYELAPVYVVAMAEDAQNLPIVAEPPDFSDQGPHLSYSIQWFGFAVIGMIGWLMLTRRKGRQST